MGGGGGETIFTLEHFDLRYVTLWIIVMIIFTMSFEFLLEKIEEVLNKQETYLRMLSKLYKELMILGFLSFFIQIILALATGLDHQQVLYFEFVHFWIFIVAILLVIHAIVFMVRARQFKKAWDRTDALKLDTVIHAIDSSDINPTWFEAHRHKWSLVFGRGGFYDDMTYHILKQFFLHTHKLHRNFDFAKYLRKNLSNFISAHLDAKSWTWILIIILLCINLARQQITAKIYERPNDDEGSTNFMFLALGWIIALMSFICLMASRRVVDKLLAKVGCVNKDDFRRILEESKENTSKLDYFIPASDWQTSFQSEGHGGHGGHEEGHGGGHSIFMVTFGHKHAEKSPTDINGIFLWDSPRIFIQFFDLLLLGQCFYLGLFCLRDIRSAFVLWGPGPGVVYLLACLIPQFLMTTQTTPRVVRNFVLASCIANKSQSVIDEVHEWMEETHTLKVEFRRRLREKIFEKAKIPEAEQRTTEGVAKAKAELAAVFKHFDRDGNQTLETRDVKHALKHLEIAATKLQLRHLMRIVDYDQSGAIDLHEFQKLVFPEDDHEDSVTHGRSHGSSHAGKHGGGHHRTKSHHHKTHSIDTKDHPVKEHKEGEGDDGKSETSPSLTSAHSVDGSPSPDSTSAEATTTATTTSSSSRDSASSFSMPAEKQEGGHTPLLDKASEPASTSPKVEIVADVELSPINNWEPRLSVH